MTPDEIRAEIAKWDRATLETALMFSFDLWFRTCAERDAIARQLKAYEDGDAARLEMPEHGVMQ